MKEAAAAIADAFRRSGSISAYYPCHGVVLSLSDSDDVTASMPETARVMEGPNDTSGYTMALFDLAGSTGRRTWRDLLLAVDGIDAPWRRELDAHFLQALGEELSFHRSWVACLRGAAVGSAIDAITRSSTASTAARRSNRHRTIPPPQPTGGPAPSPSCWRPSPRDAGPHLTSGAP